MLKTVSLALCIALASAGAAGAQSPAAPAPSAVPSKPGKSSELDRVVCEQEDTIGTRLGAKKVCMTVGQWREFQEDVKEQTRRIEILGKVSK